MNNEKVVINKDIILEKTLILIDLRNGIKDVTLRDIARIVGCVHTNLYNYFGSLNEILWEALGKTLITMLEYCTKGLTKEGNIAGNLEYIMSHLIDFSMDHPGWYRLIWLDSITGKPSMEIDSIIHKPQMEFVSLILKSDQGLTKENASSIGDIIMCYVLGELSVWMNNRSFISDREQMKKKILLNLDNLYRKMIQ